MKEYKVEVVEKHIIYVEAKNKRDAIKRAKEEAYRIEPDSIQAKILEEGDDDNG